MRRGEHAPRRHCPCRCCRTARRPPSAPTPSSMATIAAVCALASSWRIFDKMAADDVAGLVREHADQLIGRGRFHQRAGIDEDAVRIHDEGVERLVVDDDDLDVLLRQAGDLAKSARYNRAAAARSRRRESSGCRRWIRSARAPGALGQRDRGGGGKRDGARSWPHRAHLARRSGNNHVGQVSVPRIRDQTMDRKPVTVNTRPARRGARSRGSRNPPNAAAAGRCRADRPMSQDLRANRCSRRQNACCSRPPAAPCRRSW